MPKAWGVEENGELWDAAFSSRKEAIQALTEALCELGNKDAGTPGSGKPWSVRLVRVNIAIDEELTTK